MTFQEITESIFKHLPEGAVVHVEENLAQPAITISKQYLVDVCNYLHITDGLYFDYLSNLTAIDNGTVKNTFDVIYNLYSIPYNHHYIIKVVLPRLATEESVNDFVLFDGLQIPSISSITEIWKSADWHEREAFDLMGIWFDGHPDLRRILLPADWKGHPLRKDYQNLEVYHGIKVKY